MLLLMLQCALLSKTVKYAAAQNGMNSILALIYVLFVAIQVTGQSDCYWHGVDYEGTVSTSLSGITCMEWALDDPHEHDFNDHGFPSNYCRTTSDIPWCYTTDPDVRWEYCDIPECQEGFTVYTDRGCSGANEIYVGEAGQDTVSSCADICLANNACVSFEYHGENHESQAGLCQVSSSCAPATSQIYEDTDLYVHGEVCTDDSTCVIEGFYCRSTGVCVEYDSEHCHGHECGVGDGDCDVGDDAGCAAGLVCGVNNCGDYHPDLAAAGMSSETDCCENDPDVEYDCAGIQNGDAVEDACGVCDGDESSCADACGIANGDSTSCQDCCGEPNGDETSCDGLCGPCNDDDSCQGCTDSEMANYDAEATIDDSSCVCHSQDYCSEDDLDTECVHISQEYTYGCVTAHEGYYSMNGNVIGPCVDQAGCVSSLANQCIIADADGIANDLYCDEATEGSITNQGVVGPAACPQVPSDTGVGFTGLCNALSWHGGECIETCAEGYTAKDPQNDGVFDCLGGILDGDLVCVGEGSIESWTNWFTTVQGLVAVIIAIPVAIVSAYVGIKKSLCYGKESNLASKENSDD